MNNEEGIRILVCLCWIVVCTEGEGWMVINWILRAFWTTDLGMNFLSLGA